VNADRRSGPPPRRPDAGAVLREQLDESAGGGDRAITRLGHALQQKAYPSFPVPVVPDDLEQPIVLLAVLLEVQAEVEQWLA
jgi:hypothetical protein